MTDSAVIAQTTQWINSVVIGCDFLPICGKSRCFAKAFRYVVLQETALAEAPLEALVDELNFLDRTEDIETSLLIFPKHFSDFEDYLDLVELAENLSIEQGYEGVYQIACFILIIALKVLKPMIRRIHNRSPYQSSTSWRPVFSKRLIIM